MYYQYENAENVLCFYVKKFKNQMDRFILEAHINKNFVGGVNNQVGFSEESTILGPRIRPIYRLVAGLSVQI